MKLIRWGLYTIVGVLGYYLFKNISNNFQLGVIYGSLFTAMVLIVESIID